MNSSEKKQIGSAMPPYLEAHTDTLIKEAEQKKARDIFKDIEECYGRMFSLKKRDIYQAIKKKHLK